MEEREQENLYQFGVLLFSMHCYRVKVAMRSNM